MPQHAEDLMGQLDWEEWPDFELFGDGDAEDVSVDADEDAV